MMDHVSVCICTLRRNQTLERLLRNLALQETNGFFSFSVVIVDNDATGPARETVTRLKTDLALDLTYVIEPVQIIAAARNHAVQLAKGNYIGIIDDDEFPPPHWLLRMYESIKTFEVDGALGPVIPFFEQRPPAWLAKSHFCERPAHRTGTLLSWDQTRTGNVLLRKHVFDEHNLRFDLKYKTSGSDKEFFREAMALGYRFVAVEEAPVYEVVPPERQVKTYYLKRAMLQASNERKFRAPLLHGAAKVFIPMRVTAALLVYTLILPFSFFAGSHSLIRILEKCAYHLSWLLTMLGFDFAKKRN